ncbi:chymotrypsin-like elastase family member 1 isoform X2 [Varroa jacobsoni]|uniref:chymotrypsin-like elastase family member 1 isoform X2 n=1 Tax=Varroa jacobsoni TaxID=62625 RepID=UPI000BF2D213|nr:chymotrypsin-like elastase family member 1 isoform X2 [Varroa jacobsoni]
MRSVDPITLFVAIALWTELQSKCGARYLYPTFFVRGGLKVDKHEFPWQVSIQRYLNNMPEPRWVHQCGGSILSETWILTAAHCINFNLRDTPVKVVAGVDHLYSQESGLQTSNVLKAISHPLYDSQGVQESQNFEGLTCMATGWGRTSEYGDQSKKLLKVALPVLNSTVCQNKYKKVLKTALETFAATKICAGRLDKDGYGVCQGDSGGPLTCSVNYTMGSQSRNVLVLAGVNSFAKRCGSIVYPPVFTRVSHYLKWIRQVTLMN